MAGSTVARGYGADHKRLRAQLQAVVDAGEAVCWRCGRWINPEDPAGWHLGHDDDDRSIYRGVEHVRCNAGAPARNRGRRRRARFQSREW